MRAQRAWRDFSHILTVWRLKTQNFARPQGHLLGRLSEDGKDWFPAL